MRSLQIMMIEKSLRHVVRFNSDPPSVFHEKEKQFSKMLNIPCSPFPIILLDR